RWALSRCDQVTQRLPRRRSKLRRQVASCCQGEVESMRIFVTGSIAYDYIMVFPGRFRDQILPDKMHVLPVSCLVYSLPRRRCGTGANIAYNLGLLGEQPLLVGTVGDDFSDYRTWLESHGVNCRTVVVIAEEHTASCFINTDLQDNQI